MSFPLRNLSCFMADVMHSRCQTLSLSFLGPPASHCQGIIMLYNNKFAIFCRVHLHDILHHVCSVIPWSYSRVQTLPRLPYAFIPIFLVNFTVLSLSVYILLAGDRPACNDSQLYCFFFSISG